MTRNELIKRALKDVAEMELPVWAEWQQVVFGIRYDNKKVSIGDELECSQSNLERDDARDFPGYDPDAPRMDGTSAYSLADVYTDLDDADEIAGLVEGLGYLHGKDESRWDHCSLVIGWDSGDYAEDDGEVVLAGCEVVRVYW